MPNRREPRDFDEARWRERPREAVLPDSDDYGLHGEDRREYRGRESYEQQSRGGQGGRSGVWDHRFLPREYADNPRTHEQEDRQGYQNPGQRSEFDYSRSDYGNQSAYGYPYHVRPGSHHEEYEYGGRDIRTHERAASEPDRSGRAYGGEWSRNSEPSGYRGGPAARDPGLGRSDQGRYLSGEYGRQFSDPWNQQRRPNQGPKGYKRSDERIREDVCDRLSHRWDLDASEIEVTVANAEVTLAGTIQDRVQKHRAENIADSVGGVSDVHNQLRVKRDQHGQTERDQNAQNSTSGTAGTTGPRNAPQNRSS